MSQPSQFAIRWQPRDIPLVPSAVAARGEAAILLAQRLLQRDDDTLGKLEGVAGKQLIVVRGPTNLLPWADGVQYLGIDPAAPGLLSPTNYQPSVPQQLLERALAAKSGLPGMIAVLPHPQSLVPLQSARPVSRQTLAAWLEQQ